MYKNDDNRRYLKGSYTVEATVVMSLTFFVLAALIICSFYLHDRAVFQGAACEIAVTGSNFAAEKERKEAVSKAKKRISGNMFLGSKGISGNAAAGEKEASAAWNAVFPVPGFVMKYLNGNQFEITKSWKSRVFDPADTIRKIRGAEKLITGGDGG